MTLPLHPPRRCARWPAGLALAAVWAASAGAATGPEPVVGGYYDRWLAGVSPLMRDDERRVFLELDDDSQREVFIRRFWQARGLGGGAYDALARWQLSFEEALHRFGNLDEDRAQALLLAGRPAAVVVFPGCHDVIRPLRIWSYGTRPGELPAGTAPGDGEGPAGRGFHLVFYLASGTPGSYRLWPSRAGPEPLVSGGSFRFREQPVEELIDFALAKGCFRFSPADAGTFAAALRRALGPEDLRRLRVPPPAGGHWLERLAAELESPGAALPAGKAELSFPGRYQRRTIVRGRIAVPVEEVARNAEGLLFDRIVIAGDVWSGGRLVDAFRVAHLVAGSVRGGRVDLDFYRRLTPGTYALDLRVEDANGLALGRESRELVVPKLEHEAAAPAGHRLGLPGLTRSRVGVLTTFPSVELLPPGEGWPAGEVEVEAVTTGGPIERVDFVIDGAPAASAEEPPWTAVLRLGEEPRPRRLEAVAVDPAGRELARDAVTLPAASRFAVRLVEPARGSAGRTARVEVDVPAGEVLDRVELWVDDRRIATLREPPFVHPLPEGEPGPAGYVRAVATLGSGESREDLVLVQATGPVERLDVRLVELYVSVHDRQGRFVTGLSGDDFRVLEDGVAQQVRRFDTVENLAINVALAMDVSSSMRRKIEIATRSAQRFFETVLRPADRASLLVFNHDVRRIVPFTDDAAALVHGAGGFRAWGTTRLHDGVVYALHSFGGMEGKRALVLLSDGQDVDSDFLFEQVLEHTLRSSVAVYPIALRVEDPQTVADLERLASDSGGRFFQVAAVAELDRVYRRIEEELRSQYLLVYEPPPGGHELRRVDVEVLADALRARSIHGYYP